MDESSPGELTPSSWRRTLPTSSSMRFSSNYNARERRALWWRPSDDVARGRRGLDSEAGQAPNEHGSGLLPSGHGHRGTETLSGLRDDHDSVIVRAPNDSSDRDEVRDRHPDSLVQCEHDHCP